MSEQAFSLRNSPPKRSVRPFLCLTQYFCKRLACLSFPLLRRFKEVSPDQAFKMAVILGIAAWRLSNPIFNALAKNPSYLALKKDSIFNHLLELFPFVSPPILGWLTYRVAYPALSIVGMRLQACGPKPENPASPGEAPLGEGEAV